MDIIGKCKPSVPRHIKHNVVSAIPTIKTGRVAIAAFIDKVSPPIDVVRLLTPIDATRCLLVAFLEKESEPITLAASLNDGEEIEFTLQEGQNAFPIDGAIARFSRIRVWIKKGHGSNLWFSIFAGEA